METVENLKQFPLFQNLSEQQLMLLGAIAKKVYFYPGTIIYEEEDPADSFYAIATGSVRVSKISSGGEEEIYHLGPGSFFGELAALGCPARNTTVTAHETTGGVRFDCDDFRELLEDDCELAAKFYEALAHELARRLDRLSGETAFLKAFVQERLH